MQSPAKFPESISFMDQLYKIGIIQKNMFAFRFSNKANDEKSEITLGGYNELQIGKNEIKWLRNVVDNKWAVRIARVTYGDQDLPLTRPEAELITSESHLRMSRSKRKKP